MAIALIVLTYNNFRLVFWIAVIPAFIAFALIVFAGIGMLIVTDLLLAFGMNVLVMLFGAVFLGLHMGLTHGLLAARCRPTDLTFAGRSSGWIRSR